MTGSWLLKAITRVGHSIPFVDPLLPERPRAYASTFTHPQWPLTVSQSMTGFRPVHDAMCTCESQLLFEKSGRQASNFETNFPVPLRRC